MELNIRARHLELTPALSDYVHKKVEKAQRYYNSIIWAQAVLSVEKHRQSAELIVHTPGNTFRTKEESADLYSAIDSAVHKLDLHLTRTKDKERNHRHENTFKKRTPLETATAAAPSTERNKKILEVTKITLKPLSLDQAIEEIEIRDQPAFPFIDEKSNAIHILCKKGKFGFDLIQTEES